MSREAVSCVQQQGKGLPVMIRARALLSSCSCCSAAEKSPAMSTVSELSVSGLFRCMILADKQAVAVFQPDLVWAARLAGSEVLCHTHLTPLSVPSASRTASVCICLELCVAACAPPDAIGPTARLIWPPQVCNFPSSLGVVSLWMPSIRAMVVNRLLPTYFRANEQR